MNMKYWGTPGIVNDAPVVREPQVLRKLQILFVECDPNVREKMQHALENSFVVCCVTSVTQAKASLETFVPDMLISEIALGQESGLDLCRYVRHVSSLCHIPI